jgi:ubiquitin-activating enzyme E1
LFTNPAIAAKNFAKNGEHFLMSLAKLHLNQELDELRQLAKILASEKCETFEDCVKWAREKWEENFRIIIEQLIEQFPPDQKTSSGLPFWYGPKRCPHALEFNATNHLHFKFVYTAANLKALMHGIHQIRDEKRVMELIKETKVVVNKPKHVAKIKIDENNEENDEIDDEDEKELKSLKEFLKTNGPTLCKGLELTPIEFEKDDEKNLHVDFITSCSNLRAENYDIEPANEHRVII